MINLVLESTRSIQNCALCTKFLNLTVKAFLESNLQFMRVVFLCVFILCFNSLYSQDQNIADSLMIVYESGNFPTEDKPLILRGLAKYHTDHKETLFFSEELIKFAESAGTIGFIIDGYIGKGMALRMMGDIPDALENFFKA